MPIERFHRPYTLLYFSWYLISGRQFDGALSRKGNYVKARLGLGSFWTYWAMN